MARKKRRYRDTYEALKSCQYATDLRPSRVSDSDIEETAISWVGYKLNKRRRSRIGHVEKREKI